MYGRLAYGVMVHFLFKTALFFPKWSSLALVHSHRDEKFKRNSFILISQKPVPSNGMNRKEQNFASRGLWKEWMPLSWLRDILLINLIL
jgi:hypothetical protein